MRHWLFIGGLLLGGCVAAAAQFGSASRPPQKQFVEFLGAPTVTVERGRTVHVDLPFRVTPGNHVNSHEPGSELLIPTNLSLSSPGEVVVGNVSYPPGKPLTLAVAPDEKLSVYSGDFKVAASATPTAKTSPGNYRVHGQLRYQACSDRACYPPMTLPVEFDVKVVGAGGSARRNPPQSPHAH